MVISPTSKRVAPGFWLLLASPASDPYASTAPSRRSAEHCSARWAKDSTAPMRCINRPARAPACFGLRGQSGSVDPAFARPKINLQPFATRPPKSITQPSRQRPLNCRSPARRDQETQTSLRDKQIPSQLTTLWTSGIRAASGLRLLVASPCRTRTQVSPLCHRQPATPLPPIGPANAPAFGGGQRRAATLYACAASTLRRGLPRDHCNTSTTRPNPPASWTAVAKR